MDNLVSNLKKLRLNYLADNLNNFLAGCSGKEWTAKNIVERISELELVEKERRSIHRRLSAAKLGRFKRMSDFDWAWPKEVNRETIEKFLACDFITRQKNLVIAGAQGLGKTMLAKNIGYQAVLAGKSVKFTTASAMVMALQAKSSVSDLNRALKVYSAPQLLIIDELGYLSYDCKAADLIFEVINRRYEIGSIVLTTNLAFKDWNKIFPGAACLTAMIDRLTHHVEVIKIAGDSYRLMESKKDS